MAAEALARAPKTLERGSVSFLYRPRVEEQHPDELGDVQRLLILLSPAGAPFERLVAIGRKRPAASSSRDRFWGYVDLVLAPYDMQMALGPQVYGTRTRGIRHLPAARHFASGTYEIALHDDHTHLHWRVDRAEAGDPIAEEIDLEADADYVVTVANPDPAAWGVRVSPDLQSELFDELEIHVTLPTPFPPGLQRRFRNRRFAQLDCPDWLDHPGAELVFVGTGRVAS